METDNKNTQNEVTTKPKRKGGFPPGKSGNPGGRPKELSEFKELARERSQGALEKVAEILHNPDSRDSDKLKAAEMLWDRGYGKPLQSNQIEFENGPATLEVTFSDPDLERWSK